MCIALYKTLYSGFLRTIVGQYITIFIVQVVVQIAVYIPATVHFHHICMTESGRSVLFCPHRARDRESFGLFSKNKRDLYATPSAGNEMVTLRSTSPHESDEARKKEMEASNEIESFSPYPCPADCR